MMAARNIRSGAAANGRGEAKDQTRQTRLEAQSICEA
jgi:hypothetical protein